MKEEKRCMPKARTARCSGNEKRLPPFRQRIKTARAFTRERNSNSRRSVLRSFGNQRGAQTSFGNLQDEFYQQVACYYGLERGEVGSSKKHTTKYQWQKRTARKGACRKSHRTLCRRTHRSRKRKRASPQRRNDWHKHNSAPTLQREGKPTRNERRSGSNANASAWTREVAPLSAAAEAFRQASGKKPDKKQIPRSPCGKCAARKRIGVQHQRPARALYGTARIGKGKSRSEKGRRYIAHDQSPRTRQTARGNGHCQAPARKQERALSRQFVVMDKVTFLQLNISKKTIAFIKEIW